MSGMILSSPADRTAYWHQRVRAEANAALASEDPRIAALHVELATRCLHMAREEGRPLEDAELSYSP